MKLSPFISLSIFALATQVAACAGKPKAKKDEGTMRIEVDRVMPINESLDSSAVEVTLLVYNPTSKPIAIDSVAYALDTGDVGGMLKGSADSGATVEPDQESEVKFRQSIPFPEGDAYKGVLEQSTIPVVLKGSVSLGDGNKIPFERNTEVATPTLPKLFVHDAQAARYGKDGIDVTIFLRLSNENAFPVLIEGADYTVEINGKQVKSEQAAVGVRLIGNAAEEYEIGTVLDEQLFEKEKLKEILASGSVTYKVSGKVELARLTIPFEYEAEIKLASGE